MLANDAEPDQTPRYVASDLVLQLFAKAHMDKRMARKWYLKHCYMHSVELNTVMSPAPKIVSEYDQEIPQSQTADNHLVPRGRAASSNGCHSGPIFFKPEKNLEFFRLKNWPRDAYPGRLE